MKKYMNGLDTLHKIRIKENEKIRKEAFLFVFANPDSVILNVPVLKKVVNALPLDINNVKKDD